MECKQRINDLKVRTTRHHRHGVVVVVSIVLTSIICQLFTNGSLRTRNLTSSSDHSSKPTRESSSSYKYPDFNGEFKAPKLDKSITRGLGVFDRRNLHAAKESQHSGDSDMPPVPEMQSFIKWMQHQKKQANYKDPFRGNLTKEEEEKYLQELEALRKVKYESPLQLAYKLQREERRKLVPEGWNYTHNPGLEFGGNPMKDELYTLRPTGFEAFVPSESLPSSDQISEEVEEFLREQAKKLHNEAKLEANRTQEYQRERVTAEMMYKANIDDFLNATEWREVTRPRYHSRALAWLGEELYNRTFHKQQILRQLEAHRANRTFLRNNTSKNTNVGAANDGIIRMSEGGYETLVPLVDLSEYRVRDSPLPNDVVHHRFFLPEYTFYELLLSFNVSEDTVAEFGSYIKYSEEKDLIEDLHLNGVTIEQCSDIQNHLRQVAEQSVDFFPGVKLPKRALYKDPGKMLGKPRVSQLRGAMDGWWYYHRHYNPKGTPVKVDYDRFIMLQFTIRWRDYEWERFAEWEKARLDVDAPMFIEQFNYSEADSSEGIVSAYSIKEQNRMLESIKHDKGPRAYRSTALLQDDAAALDDDDEDEDDGSTYRPKLEDFT